MYAFLHIHKVMPLGFHCASYKIPIMPPPLHYAELFNQVFLKIKPCTSWETAATPVSLLSFF